MNSSLCYAATSESGQFGSHSKQMDVSFSADPLGYRLVDPQLL